MMAVLAVAGVYLLGTGLWELHRRGKVRRGACHYCGWYTEVFASGFADWYCRECWR